MVYANRSGKEMIGWPSEAKKKEISLHKLKYHCQLNKEYNPFLYLHKTHAKIKQIYLITKMLERGKINTYQVRNGFKRTWQLSQTVNIHFIHIAKIHKEHL